MSLQKTPVETLDDKRYAETFAAFASCSSEYSAMMTRIEEAVAKLLLGSSSSSSSSNHDFSCLDIGAGTGHVIDTWANSHSKIPTPSYYVAVEPNPKHYETLSTILKGLPFKSKIIQQPFTKDFSLLPDNNEEEERFDMILFSHSLYWIKDPVECVDHAMTNFLSPNGVAVIFLQGPFAFWSLCRLFEPLLERGDRPPGPNHCLSSFDIVCGLRALGTYHVDYILDPTNINLTNLPEQPELEAILSFIVQAEVSKMGQPLRKDIMEHFKGAMVHDSSGKLYLHHPNGTIIVRRKQD